MVWQAVIFGPDDTPWEGGTFSLMLEFSEEYPNKPPKVRFVSKVFHPNGACGGGEGRGGARARAGLRCPAARRSRPHTCFAPTPLLPLLPPQCTPTGKSAWTFSKTPGAPSTTSQPCSPASSRCCATPTPARQPTARPRACSRRPRQSTTGASRSASRTAGPRAACEGRRGRAAPQSVFFLRWRGGAMPPKEYFGRGVVVVSRVDDRVV